MKSQPVTTKLIIFAKAPRLGQVKSRLAASIGETAACDAYKKIAKHLLENLRELQNVEIRFAPDDAENEMRNWLGDSFVYASQGNGDLGSRLQRAFAESFEEGNRRVLIIGSDCPYVITQDIQLAEEALATNDIVLGPATDGGYWLIGMREPQPALFQNIPWSADTVLETTLGRCRENHLSFQLLRTLDDIDVAADWNKFLTRSPK